jgi:hypothetical protein
VLWEGPLNSPLLLCFTLSIKAETDCELSFFSTNITINEKLSRIKTLGPLYNENILIKIYNKKDKEKKTLGVISPIQK